MPRQDEDGVPLLKYRGCPHRMNNDLKKTGVPEFGYIEIFHDPCDSFKLNSGLDYNPPLR